MTPFIAGAVASLVTPTARRGPHGTGGTSFPSTARDAHRRAMLLIAHGADDWAEVRADGAYPAPVTFRAWRVSARSFAWQTSVMPAPAFGTYSEHDAPTVDRFGRYCAGCGATL